MLLIFVLFLRVALSTTLLLGGCGGSSTNSKEIVVSELFKNDVIIYRCSAGEGKTFEGKDEDISSAWHLKADGTFTHYDVSEELGVFAQQTDEEVLASLTEIEYSGNYKLGIDTDATGNTAETEGILYENTSWENLDYGTVKLGIYGGHVTIYDSSYILFQNPSQYGSTEFCLIKDTADTKDKDVIFDTVGTEGICVDMIAKEAFK